MHLNEKMMLKIKISENFHSSSFTHLQIYSSSSSECNHSYLYNYCSTVVIHVLVHRTLKFCVFKISYVLHPLIHFLNTSYGDSYWSEILQIIIPTLDCILEVNTMDIENKC